MELLLPPSQCVSMLLKVIAILYTGIYLDYLDDKHPDAHGDIYRWSVAKRGGCSLQNISVACYKDVTSALMRLKSPITWLFVQLFLQVINRENIKYPLWGETTDDWWNPPQMASNAESVVMLWRHHGTENTLQNFTRTFVSCSVWHSFIHIFVNFTKITLIAKEHN